MLATHITLSNLLAETGYPVSCKIDVARGAYKGKSDYPKWWCYAKRDGIVLWRICSYYTISECIKHGIICQQVSQTTIEVYPNY